MEKRKPILCLDFDGVIHSYDSGWQGADVIPDPMVPGTAEFLDRAIESFDIHIYSSRSHQFNGVDAMQLWLKLQLIKAYGPDKERAIQVFEAISWPMAKPPAMLTIDDRALTFDGHWPDVEMLLQFKPWNKN